MSDMKPFSHSENTIELDGPKYRLITLEPYNFSRDEKSQLFP